MTEHCPTCQKRTRFHEVEVTKKYGLFFVDVLNDSERAFRCERCEDVFDLRDAAVRTEPAPPVKTDKERLEELAAEQRKRDERRAAVATKIEDDLAALKKKMGR